MAIAEWLGRTYGQQSNGWEPPKVMKTYPQLALQPISVFWFKVGSF